MPLFLFHARFGRALLSCLGCLALAHAATPEPGLLFHVSGEKGTQADYSAAGTPDPTFDEEVTRVADGAQGAALRCGNLQRLAWRAPGNIYAQRGTLSFYWRSREPVGPTEFPLFRVAFADHTSWDMVWLRIDYNGHGFDAFVTDASLSRIRVSTTIAPFPKPNEWVHLALSWDETKGIRFYVNGQPAAAVDQTACLNVALDQFGPHSRIISPHNVQSDYNFMRGGDIDEIRIHDRMLDDAQIAALVRSGAPGLVAEAPTRDMTDPQWADEWALRYGWDHEAPPELPAEATAVRKVELSEARDVKRWYYKACDGIRETTWPGVYNRSRLPGRNDYFQLPDWDCYVDSGKAITFYPPSEAWNHIEISGAAFGRVELSDKNGQLLFERPAGREKTIHRLPSELKGGQVRFTNSEQETPIGEFELCHVVPGKAPQGSASLSYRLGAGSGMNDATLLALQNFVRNRFPEDERATLVATPKDSLQALSQAGVGDQRKLPLVQIFIPNQAGPEAYSLDKVQGGLDGIELRLPALQLKPTHGGLIALNVQVKDPLWPLRNMLDFSFSVKPGEAHRLWLDLRDRLLPPGKPLYLTIACSSPDFSSATLAAAELRLIFKPAEAALPEHEADRFSQARDSYAFLVEEHPHDVRYDLWNRFEGDIRDLMRVNPQHYPGRNYFAVGVEGTHLKTALPQPPASVPLWAFRQVDLLGRAKAFANWYIDERQSDFGDFGGGISDDTDLLNQWPGIALMGCEPDKLKHSLNRLLDAAYKNGMFTRGLSTIQTDELHSYEDGINCIGANLILDPGSPLQLERAMETMRGVTSITGVNAAGHRHIRSSYYSGSRVAEEGVWGWAKAYSYLVLQPGQLLVNFNGNPAAKQTLLELTDSLLAHRKKRPKGRFTLPSAIEFATDKDGVSSRGYLPWPMFWNAWQWTGDRRYLEPLFDGGMGTLFSLNPNALDILGLREEWGPRILEGEAIIPIERRPDKKDRGSARSNSYRASSSGHFLWQVTGDKSHLEKLYADLIEECEMLKYINTEGSLWIDRIGVPTTDLQRERLGGIALARNSTFPGHVASWSFEAPANDQSVAILIPDATPTSFKVIAYNLETSPTSATLTGCNIDPGAWEISQGVDSNGDDVADASSTTRMLTFGLGEKLRLQFPPRCTTILQFTLRRAARPYRERPDLGLEACDLSLGDKGLKVILHSLGSVPTPPARIQVSDAAGTLLASIMAPSLEAPVDLIPRTLELSIPLPAGSPRSGLRVEIDPEHKLEEITRSNNVAVLGSP